MDNIDKEIEDLQSTIKRDMCKMRDLEHQPGIVGVGLKPMSGSEARTLNKAFGY